MRINNEDLLEDSGPQDMSNDFTLIPIYLGHISNYAIQMTFSGSPTGAFTLECSNDPGNPNVTPFDPKRWETVTHWTTIAGSSQSIVAAGDHTYQVQNAGYLWVRVVWTDAGGTGSLVTAVSNVKGV